MKVDIAAWRRRAALNVAGLCIHFFQAFYDFSMMLVYLSRQNDFFIANRRKTFLEAISSMLIYKYQNYQFEFPSRTFILSVYILGV